MILKGEIKKVLTQKDCYLLLMNLQEEGIDTQEQINLLTTSQDIPLQVIKFINDKRQLDLTNFYEHIRKSYI